MLIVGAESISKSSSKGNVSKRGREFMHFFIGTRNKAKLQAVQLATQDQWPDAVIVGYDVESGVASQPMSDEETLQGTQNRAQQAMERGRAELSDLDPTAYLAIGLEGGVTVFNDELWSTVWVAVLDASDKFFTANGARMKLAPQIAQPIQNGEEMGPVMERLMGVDNIRQKQGMLGVVTKSYVTRAEEYGGIAKLAIGIWYGKDWVDDILEGK